MGKLIAIIGITGVGKTTLARALSASGEFVTGLEQHDARPFQTAFLVDKTYALANQIDYLLLRAEQESTLRKFHQTSLVDGGLDQDFHGFTHLFHFLGFLNDNEFHLCERFYNFCRAKLSTPDLIIHLTAQREIILDRLKSRSRINITRPEDLAQLESFLNIWLAGLPKEKVLHVDVSNVSSSYLEIIPSLKQQIAERLGLELINYDTGYIP